MERQLWPSERLFLFEAILDTKPFRVFEAGTCNGRGSTYQIALGLQTVGHGHLHTCEPNPQQFAQAHSLYRQANWAKFVTCYNLRSDQLIRDYIGIGHFIPDFLFFDGPDDPEENLANFEALEDIMPYGAHFCMHDWELTESAKAERLRPYLEESPKWDIIKELIEQHGGGMVLARKRSLSDRKN